MRRRPAEGFAKPHWLSSQRGASQHRRRVSRLAGSRVCALLGKACYVKRLAPRHVTRKSVAASRSVAEGIPADKTDIEESRATIAGQPGSRGDLVLVDPSMQREEAKKMRPTRVTSPSANAGVKYKPSSLPAWNREPGPDPSVADLALIHI